MAAEQKTSDRGTIATVIATAAVTLAIGVTAAALGGYLAPARDRDRTAAAQPSVVLVPIAPDGRPAPSATVPESQAPEVRFAAHEAAEHDDDEGDHDDD